MARILSRWKAAASALFAAALSTFTASGVAQTADYPTRPITLVVPFAAGGGLDITARLFADRLKDILGQPVIIANRPGAGSSVGARVVATAAPDGHTLLITSGSAFGFAHLLVPNFEYRVDSFAPVAMLVSNPSVIAASTSVPASSLKELVDLIRAKPDAVAFCSTGMNGINHLQLEMFKRLVQARTGQEAVVTHVPYNGLAPALGGLKGREVQACMLPYTALVRTLQDKDLRILAVQSATRLPWLPNVPTTGEQGFPEMDSNNGFINVVAPRGTPEAVIAKLEGAFQQVLRDPGVLRKLEELDIQPAFRGSQAMRVWLEEDVAKYTALIRQVGIKRPE